MAYIYLLLALISLPESNTYALFSPENKFALWFLQLFSCMYPDEELLPKMLAPLYANDDMVL